MIPHIIHFCVPRQISITQQSAIDLAREKNPGWEVKVWQDPVDRAGFKLARYWDSVNSGAQLADLIRLEVVHRFGGVYLDSDMKVLRPLAALADHCQFFIGSENGNLATNAAFGSVAGHPALERLIHDLLESPPDWRAEPNDTTGPGLFSRILKWRTDITVLPREVFYPYYVDEVPRAPHPASYCVHLWAASWHDDHKPETVSAVRRMIAHAGLRKPLRQAKRHVKAARTWVARRLEHVRIVTEAARHKLLAPKLLGYSASNELVRQTVHGPHIMLAGGDISITPKVFANGYYELREELFLKRALRGGDFFVDVGANVGTFSILAATRVGRFGRVFSYEPNPIVADLLKKSAAMNWMHERIVVRPVAVGANASSAKLEVAPSLLGGVGLMQNDGADGTSEQTRRYLGATQQIDVKVVRLDDEFPYNLPIRILKIDAEGFEAEVLAGARRLFESQSIDYAMLEAIDEVAGNSWRTLMNSLGEIISLGYVPCVFDRIGAVRETTLDRIARGLGSRNILLKRSAVQ